MNPNHNAPSKSSPSRKRKGVKEEDEAGPSVPPPSLSPSLQKSIDNAMLAVSTNLSLKAEPSPDSYWKLLTQDDQEEAQLLQNQMDDIDKLIQAQNENIRSMLQDLWNETVQAMNKRVKDKEVESDIMRQIAEGHKNNSEQWQARAQGLEQAMASLRTAMHKTLEDIANMNRPGGNVEDEAESSFVDPGPMASRVKCKTCDKKPAKVMLWPCRHVAVCTSCEEMVKDCPLCGATKDSFYKVNLS